MNDAERLNQDLAEKTAAYDKYYRETKQKTEQYRQEREVLQRKLIRVEKWRLFARLLILAGVIILFLYEFLGPSK